MFKKLHLQFALFSSLITSAILIIMSLACLVISESGIKKNGYTTFLNDVNSMMTYLENQSAISYEWLVKMQNNHQFIIDIVDNNKPLLFSSLDQSEERTRLIEQAYRIAKTDHAFDPSGTLNLSVLSQQVNFKMTDFNNNQYYATVAAIPKNTGQLDVVVVYSLNRQNLQIKNQRFLFICIDILGAMILTLFSLLLTKRMIKPIEENQRRQIEFVAAASHELRSPLAVIMSSLSAMKKSDSASAERFTDTIESEGARMSRLINDMLSLASAENNTWSVRLEDIELDTLLLDAYEKFYPITRKKSLNLSINLPDTPISKCRCDKVRTEQVLSIIIENAISYTGKGGNITLSLLQTHNHLEIRIIDNGPGIPDEHKKQVFERFYRVDVSHHERDHFGLGLCIAKEILKLHKGRIFIEDTPGGGATFVLWMPCV